MKLLLGMALTAVIAYLVQFFRMTLDYTGVHKLQFEDEEYLYYVKAVPKMKVAPGDKTVTRIEEDRDEGMIDLKEEIEKVLEEVTMTEEVITINKAENRQAGDEYVWK